VESTSATKAARIKLIGRNDRIMLPTVKKFFIGIPHLLSFF
jgi:hypothetical protein